MYQFIHIEVFAKTISKKAISRRKTEDANGRQKQGTKSLLTVRDVIAEAQREPDASFHVEQVQDPILVYGVPLDEVEKMAYESTEGFKDSRGRKLRDDTPILLAGVSSYPKEAYDRNRDAFKQWLTDNIAWLQQEYGSNLKNITLHQDEAHPHIHFYAISKTGRAKDIHAGYRAEQRLDSASTSSSNKSNMKAYQQGMRDFQERFYLEVGMPNGMTKLGARKQRLTRAEKKSRDQEAQSMAARLREIEAVDKMMANEIQDLVNYKMAEAEQDRQGIISTANEEATKSAQSMYKSIINQFKDIGKEIIESARKEAQKIREEVNMWGRNHLENMRRLTFAEKQLSVVTDELSAVKAERDLFAEQYRLLKEATNKHGLKH